MADTGTIPLVREGADVSAADMNRVIAAVNTLRLTRRGPEFIDRVPARVTRIYGNQIEDLAGNVRYDFTATAIDVVLTNRAPDYGRPFRESDIRIHPARVGSRCFIHRFINEAGEMDHKVELPFGGEGECLAISRCGNSAQRGLMRVLMEAGGGALPPAPPPGGDGPITGDAGGPVGGGEI